MIKQEDVRLIGEAPTIIGALERESETGESFAAEWEVETGEKFTAVPDKKKLLLTRIHAVNMGSENAEYMVKVAGGVITAGMLKPSKSGLDGTTNEPVQAPLFQGDTLEAWAGSSGVHIYAYGILEWEEGN